MRVRDDLAWLREAVVPLILDACPEAERIWLFGSRARGDHHDASDWDVMVVVPDGSRDAARETVREAVRGLGAGVEAHVWDHGAFTDRLHLRASFPATVAREGRILYEEVAMSAVDARMWLRRAAADLRAVEALIGLDPPEVAGALLHAQQAVERAAKGLLARRDIPCPKTHELDRLGDLVRPTDPELGDRVAALDGFGDTAVTIRYADPDADPTAQEVAGDLETVRRLVTDLRDWVAALGDAPG